MFPRNMQTYTHKEHIYTHIYFLNLYIYMMLIYSYDIFEELILEEANSRKNKHKNWYIKILINFKLFIY